MNFYVFHGGVNYGFTAGGGTDRNGNYPIAVADITSYGKWFYTDERDPRYSISIFFIKRL